MAEQWPKRSESGCGTLGIRAPLLYRWAHLEREPEAKARSTTGHSVAELEAEIGRLRAENSKLLEQREVLKKTLGNSSPSCLPKECSNRTNESAAQDRPVVRSLPG